MTDFQRRLRQAITDLELDRIAPLVREALAEQQAAPDLLAAMTAGMADVGELFEEGEYFLADLVLAAEAMKEGLAVLEPQLASERSSDKACIVLCTVKGDVHDIGKNLVAHMLGTAGFKVVDLGVDVPVDQILAAVRQHGARALGLSVLLTPMVASVAEVVTALTEAGLRSQLKIAIGGACTTDELAERLGVDAVGRDAVQAVQLFESFMKD